MCQHHNIVKEYNTATCADCNTHFAKSFCTDYTTNHNGPILDTKSTLIKCLEKSFGIFDVNVNSLAEEIFILTSKNKILKGNNKKSILCASIYYAYFYLEKPKKFEDILCIFGLTHKNGLKGLKLCQIALQEQPLDKGKIYLFTTTHKENLESLIKKYNIPLNYYNDIEKIIITCHLKKNRNLSEKINNLWISSIFYWLIKINPYIDLEEFVSIDDKYISVSQLKSDLIYLEKHIKHIIV